MSFANGRQHAVRTLALFLAIGVVVSGLVGCGDRPMRRPVVTLGLGDFSQFTAPFTYRPDTQIMVFRDENGLSFMSTNCTYDLALLKFAKTASGEMEFSSPHSASRYSLTGEVLAGPAKFRLPFYRARYAEEKLGGPKTSIYVEIPTEVDGSWRLPVPPPGK